MPDIFWNMRLPTQKKEILGGDKSWGYLLKRYNKLAQLEGIPQGGRDSDLRQIHPGLTCVPTGTLLNVLLGTGLCVWNRSVREKATAKFPDYRIKISITIKMVEKNCWCFLWMYIQRGEDLTPGLGIPKGEKSSFKYGSISKLLSLRLLFISFYNFWYTVCENKAVHNLKQAKLE